MAENKDDEKTKRDEEIKEFCQKRSTQKAAGVASFLERVALDDSYRDLRANKVKVFDSPDKKEFHYEYEEVSVPVSVNIRVTAAKTWKEMIFDKAVGDIKEKAKDTREKGVDMKRAMEAIAAAKAKEKTEAKEEEL